MPPVAKPDTIAAIATAPGQAGIGVVRVSGTKVAAIARQLTNRRLPARQAVLTSFRDASGDTIDQGIALLFPPPGSYTGEAVLELQAHGSPVVLDLLLSRTIELGARLARPGEFTERAFLNGKLDLTQAEAVADLIASTNRTQLRLARRTLDGALTRRVDGLRSRLTEIRVRLEAGLDFSDEDIDLLELGALGPGIDQTMADLTGLVALARQGERIRDGMKVVIAGPPNAGKSSLLNQLCGHEAAIVTAVPGTTRDVISTEIHLDGMPLHLVDTAGLRNSQDVVEMEGIRRAREQIGAADLVLWLYDAASDARPRPEVVRDLIGDAEILLVRNKIDLTDEQPGRFIPKTSGLDAFGADVGSAGEPGHWSEVRLCALRGQGLEYLRQHLKDRAGLGAEGENAFLARRRHLTALEKTLAHLRQAKANLAGGQPAEILAEDLRLAQRALGEITGQCTSEDLLGQIFATFCIGK